LAEESRQKGKVQRSIILFCFTLEEIDALPLPRQKGYREAPCRCSLQIASADHLFCLSMDLE
jgi:hypothetical protein